MVVAAGFSPLLLLLVLACPLSMVFMMRSMGRGRTKHAHEEQTQASDRPEPEAAQSLAELKAEHARLAAKIDGLEESRVEANKPARSTGSE